MAEKSYEVRFNTLTATRSIRLGRDGVLNSLAFRTEGLAKERMSVDTGFMQNSTQAIPVNTPSKSGGSQVLTDRAGQVVERFSNATPQTGPGVSAVAVAADYAFWREMEEPALQPAIDQALSDLSSIVKENEL
jgi:hypothetical protein